MAARGNATSFPLLWAELLSQLHEAIEPETSLDKVDLPRSGDELCNCVSMVLKTSDESDSKES